MEFFPSRETTDLPKVSQKSLLPWHQKKIRVRGPFDGSRFPIHRIIFLSTTLSGLNKRLLIPDHAVNTMAFHFKKKAVIMSHDFDERTKRSMQKTVGQEQSAPSAVEAPN
jgi:hypothetical protein